MPPRALTDQERLANKVRLFNAAKILVFKDGIKAVSIENIARAAGVSKGSFYQYYPSKEALLLDILWQFFNAIVTHIEQVLAQTPAAELERTVRDLIMKLTHDDESTFFFTHHDELVFLIATADRDDVREISDLEISAIEKLIAGAGLDPQCIRPGLVRNYINALLYVFNDHTLIESDRDEVIEVMLDGLMAYIFKDKDISTIPMDPSSTRKYRASNQTDSQ